MHIPNGKLFHQDNGFSISFRQHGRSYLGVLGDGQSSPSLLDIPFSDIDNIVLSQSSLPFSQRSIVHVSGM